MKFSELFSSYQSVKATVGDAEVVRVTADSRACKPGTLFVAMPSKARDTHEFIASAADLGAVAVLAHTEAGFLAAKAKGLAAAWVADEGTDFNVAVGCACKAVYGDPSSKLRLIAITGTNGKTTTTWMVRDALAAIGRKSGYLGTLGFQAGSPLRVIPNTTPFPAEMWELLNEAASDGLTDLALEASSHALFEKRLWGVNFDLGLFTNLTQDHLDFHGTMSAYEDAKKLLFTDYAAASNKAFKGVLNISDATGRKWASDLPDALTYGASDAQLVVVAEEVTVSTLRLRTAYKGEEQTVTLNVGGLFNVENASSALAVLIGLGYPLKEAIKGLAAVTPVPGRFESIKNDKGFGVIVDYAHTPDALAQLLESARALKPSRIITVFGCGGDRDRTKRPKMAKTVSERSEVTVVTSDNPRTENPETIMDEIVPGIVAGVDYHRIADRREAIAHAVKLAQPGDIVVIAGKGHEDYQIIGRTKYHMDDREMAREALEALA